MCASYFVIFGNLRDVVPTRSDSLVIATWFRRGVLSRASTGQPLRRPTRGFNLYCHTSLTLTESCLISALYLSFRIPGRPSKIDLRR